MNKPSPKITKVCTSCGQRKPLSAFMQIAGPEGTTYTQICAECRRANLKATPIEKDESTTSDSKHNIDAKTKVKAETDKRKLRQEIEENYFEERGKGEKKTVKKIETREILVKGEKQHRDRYLKSGSFLDANKKKEADAKNIHGSLEQESEAGRFNFAAPVEDTRMPKMKHTGSIFNQFKTWLGDSAPARHLEKQNASSNSKKPNEKEIKEYINNKWGPGSKK